MNYIRWFKDLRISDVPSVGGKNASLGEMFSQLSEKGILIPDGFAVTADGYWHYIDHNNLRQPIANLMTQLTDTGDLEMLERVGSQVRQLIKEGTMPDDIQNQIVTAYQKLSKEYNQEFCDVAVRSSATAEDLPHASFAGQQETYLNIRGNDALLHACKKALASLFTNRAIVYRQDQGFSHFDVALSLCVQKMTRADLASSGVAFSLDTESGFKDAIIINSSYGLGETIVQGLVTPDEFIVHKPTLEKGFASIIKKQHGDKKIKMTYHKDTTQIIPVSEEDYNSFSLSDEEILSLARSVLIIEQYYSEQKSHWSPMDVEWAKDGQDNKIYILQARPETIHSLQQKKHNILSHYILTDNDPEELIKKAIATGQSIGQRIVHGIARVVKNVSEISHIQPGDIIVTQMTDPDWVPAMKRAKGIITERGGRTCHAAIVSRELNVTAIVGAEHVTTLLHDGQQITIDCSRGSTGYIYAGHIPFEVKTTELKTLPTLPIKLMVNIADPNSAFSVASLPKISGVGLARLEFIISGDIKVHPMALVHPEKITDDSTRKTIDKITAAYRDGKEFFVDQLACNVGMIAAAFYPQPVIVRFSDFKSNEYRNLIGGIYFEPEEENPMIGFRGASRYYHEQYREAFALECAAMKKVRDTMGLTNVTIMIPFVRTTTEGQKVIQEMASNGLVRGQNDLRVIMMCEIPSNVILIDDFSKIFDGFSIGSNDLTQMTLGVDRDSHILATAFDERDPAVTKLMAQAIQGAKRNNRPIGICGQGPSDYPELAAFLIEQGIDSLSLNPDSIMPFLMRYTK